MTLSIVIVNWNSKDYVRKCVQSIYANARDISFEVLVVDNGSHDGCAEMLAREFPEVNFIQAGKNVGFSQANNLAFERSSGACVMFLNPDTEIVGSAINELYAELMKSEDIGGVAPKLVNDNLTVQKEFVRTAPTILSEVFDSDLVQRLFSKAQLSDDQVDPVEIEILPGACIMTRRETFERAGRFAPEYFMYCEDVDLSCQIKRLGLRNYYIPSARVIHHGGGSSKGAISKFSAVMTRESVWKFLTKTRGRYYALGYRGSTIFAAAFRLLLLGVLLPVNVIRGKWGSTRNSIRKWAAILSWSVGAETWTRRYN
jgi:N-acetylglucosaminyl-diphospho-decaprenol L-rhamnosyltransferase